MMWSFKIIKAEKPWTIETQKFSVILKMQKFIRELNYFLKIIVKNVF